MAILVAITLFDNLSFLIFNFVSRHNLNLIPCTYVCKRTQSRFWVLNKELRILFIKLTYNFSTLVCQYFAAVHLSTNQIQLSQFIIWLKNTPHELSTRIHIIKNRLRFYLSRVQIRLPYCCDFLSQHSKLNICLNSYMHS